MSKKSKKGKKPLNQTEALAYVRRKLAKAAKYSSPAMITKAARRPVAPVPSAADDVARYRARLDQELWGEYIADDDPKVRNTALMITKAAGAKSQYDRRRARAYELVTNPCDPAQQKRAFDYAFGFKESV
jgi:hypothetical protein